MKIVSFKLPDDLYSDLEELASRYARGDKSEFLRMLITRELARLRCPVLFLAGSGTAIDAAIGSGIKPLNWLLSAGTYYRGGKFSILCTRGGDFIMHMEPTPQYLNLCGVTPCDL